MSLGQSKAAPAAQIGVPGIYVLLLCDVLRQFGHDDGQLLAELGISRAGLLSPDSRIPVLLAHSAARRAIAMAGDQGLGPAYASALKVTLHGSLGMMALSSPSIGAALEAAGRYLVLRAPFLSMSHRIEGDRVRVRFEARAELADLRDFVMEMMLIGLAHIAEQLLGAPLENASLSMPGPPPLWYQRQRMPLPVPIHYGADIHELVLPVSVFDAAPRLADPAVAALAREQCEQEFQLLFRAVNRLSERVAAKLAACPDASQLPDLEAMAKQLHVSSRTLKRRLQDEGCQWRHLLEAELCRRACEALRRDGASVSEVAFALGYQDASNFSRAFRRWTGLTPKAWLQHPPVSGSVI
ncbi:MAG: helix-turn-helix domain-containing protein [Alcanivoracaceae bacterium]